MFQPELETEAVEARSRRQDQRLTELLARLRRVDTAYWRHKLADVGEVSGVADLTALPFTRKAELRDTYPFGMLTVPLAECVRVHASSGTRGKPTIVAYTREDVALFAEVNARAIACAGARPDDVIQVAYGYGLFTGGLGLHYGVEHLGATAIPASGGNPALQLQLMRDLGSAGLCATPSFALLLAERAAADGISGLALRYGVFGAEPWSDAMRTKLEQAWSAVSAEAVDACDIYGLSEIIGPGVAMECREGKGALHVFSDHFLPEVVDPSSGEPVAAGETGELVLTTLTKAALPVLRYRTGDLTTFVDEACACGRTFPRIARFTGRVDDMIVVRGVNVFPSEIEAVVLDDEALAGQYALVLDRRAAMAELEVRVELAEAAARSVDAEASAQQGLQRAVGERIAARLLERLRVRVRATVGAPGSLPRQEVGKAKRVFDPVEDAALLES